MRDRVSSLLTLSLVLVLSFAAVEQTGQDGNEKDGIVATALPREEDSSHATEDQEEGTAITEEAPVKLEAFGFESHVDNAIGAKEAGGPLTSSNFTLIEETVTSSFPKPQSRQIKCLRRTTHQANIVPDVSTDDDQDSAIATSNEKSNQFPVVELVNGSQLLHIFSEAHNPKISNRSVAAACHLVMFYAPWCPFSAEAAPHFNALARVYPDVTLFAVDSRNQGINTQFGILSIPTLIIFHNTKPISKFNHTNYTVDNFVSFMDTFTFLKPAAEAAISDGDWQGPLPTQAVEETDYYLWLAWLFTIACAIGYFGKSSFWARITENVRNNWREVEIQHEHMD